MMLNSANFSRFSLSPNLRSLHNVRFHSCRRSFCRIPEQFQYFFIPNEFFFISRRFWTLLKTVPNVLIFYSLSFALGFVINAESQIHLNRENTFFPRGIELSTPLSKADRRMLSHTFLRKSSKVVKGGESNPTHPFPIAEMPFYKVQSCIGCKSPVFLKNNRYQSGRTIRSSHQILRNFKTEDIKELLKYDPKPVERIWSVLFL